MTRRVLLHVGAPKTGTSFVQDILFTHREALRERGILYPADRHDAHFLAALDLMELPWGGLEQRGSRRLGPARRRGARLARAPRSSATRSWARASRVRSPGRWSRSGGDDAEIHIVYSARDLVRQIPAEWQENVKHRRTRTYGRFLESLRDPERSTEVAQWFWGVQEVPDVLDRWGALAPPRTGPPGHRAAARLRARRCCGSASPACSASTPSSSPPRTRPTPRSAYPSRRWSAGSTSGSTTCSPTTTTARFVREMLVHRNLSAHAGSPRLSLPPTPTAGRATLGRSWVSELALRGYDVVGDLDDLVARRAPALRRPRPLRRGGRRPTRRSTRWRS